MTLRLLTWLVYGAKFVLCQSNEETSLPSPIYLLTSPEQEEAPPPNSDNDILAVYEIESLTNYATSVCEDVSPVTALLELPQADAKDSPYRLRNAVLQWRKPHFKNMLALFADLYATRHGMVRPLWFEGVNGVVYDVFESSGETSTPLSAEPLDTIQARRLQETPQVPVEEEVTPEEENNGPEFIINRNSVGLSEEGEEYVYSLVPYITPLILAAIIALIIAPILAISFCSASCRRFIPCSPCIVLCCGGNPTRPQPFRLSSKLCISLGSIIWIGGVIATGSLSIYYTNQLIEGIKVTRCATATTMDVALNGFELANGNGFSGGLALSHILLELKENFTNNAEKIREEVLEVIDKTAQLDLTTQVFDKISSYAERIYNDATTFPSNYDGPNLFHFILAAEPEVQAVMMEGIKQALSDFTDSIDAIRDNADLDIAQAAENISKAVKTLPAVLLLRTVRLITRGVQQVIEFDESMNISLTAFYWVAFSISLLVMLVSTLYGLWIIYLFGCSKAYSEFPATGSLIGLTHLGPFPSQTCPLCCWSWLVIFAVTALLIAGLNGFVTAVEADICLVGSHVLDEENQGFDVLTRMARVDDAKLRSMISDCLMGVNAEQISKALGLDDLPELLENAQEVVDKIGNQVGATSLTELKQDMKKIPTLAAQLAKLIRIDTDEVNNNYMESKLTASDTVLQSGVQDKSITLPWNNDIDLSQKIFSPSQSELKTYGLLDIENLIAPFYFLALHPQGLPNDSAREFAISKDFDPMGPEVLLEAEKRETPQEQQEYLNAVWWSKIKQSTRSLPGAFVCRNPPDAAPYNCPYDKYISYVDEVLVDPFETLTPDEDQTLPREYVEGLLEDSLLSVQAVAKNLNCSSVSATVRDVRKAWCNSVSHSSVSFR